MASPAPLIASKSKLDMHFKRTGKILADSVEISENVGVGVDWELSTIEGGLNGAGCESISRTRGPLWLKLFLL